MWNVKEAQIKGPKTLTGHDKQVSHLHVNPTCLITCDESGVLASRDFASPLNDLPGRRRCQENFSNVPKLFSTHFFQDHFLRRRHQQLQRRTRHSVVRSAEQIRASLQQIGGRSRRGKGNGQAPCYGRQPHLWTGSGTRQTYSI